MHTHIFGPNFQEKISFVLIFKFNYFVLRYLFLYYKGILAFIFDHIMVQEILCNNYKIRTDTRYFRYYPCIMHILIFPSKISAQKCALYAAKYGI